VRRSGGGKDPDRKKTVVSAKGGNPRRPLYVAQWLLWGRRNPIPGPNKSKKKGKLPKRVGHACRLRAGGKNTPLPPARAHLWGRMERRHRTSSESSTRGGKGRATRERRMVERERTVEKIYNRMRERWVGCTFEKRVWFCSQNWVERRAIT